MCKPFLARAALISPATPPDRCDSLCRLLVSYQSLEAGILLSISYGMLLRKLESDDWLVAKPGAVSLIHKTSDQPSLRTKTRHILGEGGISQLRPQILRWLCLW